MNFKSLLQDISVRLKVAPGVQVKSWQSTAAPEPMPELLNYSFTYDLPTHELQFYRDQIQPNLPWADDHFELERSSGEPLNPGTTWKYWVSGTSADSHREDSGQYSHSYAERFWPKFAGQTADGKLPEAGVRNWGIRYNYGDLGDLVNVIGRDPLTRQAYLPVWFPEDLAAATQSKRVPCTLGYHFIVRENKLHIIYYLRSCDFVRHFKDDVYLAIRLAKWVLDQLRIRYPIEPFPSLEDMLSQGMAEHSDWMPLTKQKNLYRFDWNEVSLGSLTMHITSLHCFESDRSRL